MNCKKTLVIIIVFLGILIFGICFYKNRKIEQYNPELENGKMIIYKLRSQQGTKIVGTNYCVPKDNVYIYYNSESWKGIKYVIYTSENIYATNNKNKYWDILKNLIFKEKVSNLIIINYCLEPNGNNELYDYLMNDSDFNESAVDFYCENENYLFSFEYMKTDICFEKTDICLCGSDSWVAYENENYILFNYKLIMNNFYY